MRQILLEELKQYYALWRETNAIYEQWAKKHQISYYELLIFTSLWGEEQLCTQKQLCEQWTLPKQTVHSILKNFEGKNWVELKTVEADRRNKAIFLTESGRAFCKVVMEDLQQHECAVWEKLGAPRRKALLENTALYIKYFKGGGQNENQ